MPKALITGITGQDGAYLPEFLLLSRYNKKTAPNRRLGTVGGGFY